MLYIGVGQTYFSLITLLCYLLNFVPYIYIYISYSERKMHFHMHHLYNPMKLTKYFPIFLTKEMNREVRGGTRTRAHFPCHSLLAPPAVASSTTSHPCLLWLLPSGSTTPKSSLRESATRGFTQGTVSLAQSHQRVVGATVLCGWFQPALTLQAARPSSPGLYLSMMTGSEGVSFRLPQLFRSQHRLKERWGGREGGKKEREITVWGVFVCVRVRARVCVWL